MDKLVIILAVTIVSWAVYLLLPAFVCRLGRLAAVRWNFRPGLPAEDMKPACLAWLPGTWRQRLTRRLQHAGYFGDNALYFYLALQTAPIPAMLILGRLAGTAGAQSLLLGIVLMSLVNTWISRRISRRKKAFAGKLFKIYRFLDLQMTAGIKITDSLRGLPEAIQDDIVQPILVRFAALYELTLDLDLAFAEIRLAFGGPDCDILATHLRQCLQTGEGGQSLARMEELLFSRYFNMMQADTRKIRTKLLIAAILGIVPGVIVFLYPLLYEATQAMRSVFG